MDFHHSLAFGGGVGFVTAFWVSYAACVGAELYWNATLQPKERSGADRGSYLILVISGNIAFALDFASVLFLPSQAMASAKVPMFVAGVLLEWIGLALRGYAIRTLGRSFTVQVRAVESQEIVTAGPYRYVRHPSYTGSLLIGSGIALALGNWLGLVVVVATLSAGFAYRIAVEERALASTLGAPYRDYMRRTWRVMPGLV